jgi:hypothetical protein
MGHTRKVALGVAGLAVAAGLAVIPSGGSAAAVQPYTCLRQDPDLLLVHESIDRGYTSVATDDTGNVYVAWALGDGLARIEKYDPDGDLLWSKGGDGTWARPTLDVRGNGTVFVTDRLNDEVWQLSGANGVTVGAWDAEDMPGFEMGIAVAAASSGFVVLNETVFGDPVPPANVFRVDGTLDLQIDAEDANPDWDVDSIGDNMHDVEVGSNGSIWVSESGFDGNRRVFQFNSSGTQVRVVDPTFPAVDNHFGPEDIDVEDDGDLWVQSNWNEGGLLRFSGVDSTPDLDIDWYEDGYGELLTHLDVNDEGTELVTIDQYRDPVYTFISYNRVRRWDVLSCSFRDVRPTNPFFDEIEWMAAEGISTGYDDGTYKPAATVTRQAMSAFMFRLAGTPLFLDPAAPTFGDVSASNPFFTEIEWMASEGITTGTPFSPKPLYKPSAAVSRGAMAAFMYRLAGSPAFSPPGSSTFGDVTSGHPFFAPIEWMADEGISTGTAASPKPLYKPANAVSRGAMSAFMFRLDAGPGVDV